MLGPNHLEEEGDDDGEDADADEDQQRRAKLDGRPDANRPAGPRVVPAQLDDLTRLKNDIGALPSGQSDVGIGVGYPSVGEELGQDDLSILALRPSVADHRGQNDKN